ncbi:MAG: helix-turn-helix domain-containing protein [Candidatus Accumulibacter sp.]|uniref:RodZ domain-containing protein n=1 Tax=Accumulibacter sp. TaxID=2053492 RepID=UPI001A5B1FFF|nr:RodZ domain-containing protein [Accumulibacter sp.]MBL8396181.1 helix-turn-helix domain-containing protein [Accumulibacter sp.]
MSEQGAFPAEGSPSADQSSRLPVVSSEAVAPGGVGAQLRAAREAKNISLAEAAQSLKLGTRQVEALEAEDWHALPGSTMIRGFVRNHARLTGLDPEPLMRALDAAQLPQTPQLEVSAGTSASLPQAGGRRVERRDYLAVLAGLSLLGLATLAYFYAPLDRWQAQLTDLLERRSAGAAQERAVTMPAVPVPAESAQKGASGESVIAVAPPNATVLSDTPAGVAPASGGGPATAGSDLRLSFAQSAWVEIRDTRGQVLLSGVMPAGSQRELAGEAPFSLVIGNSTQVTVQYRGRVIDLAAYSKGEVARLSLE